MSSNVAPMSGLAEEQVCIAQANRLMWFSMHRQPCRSSHSDATSSNSTSVPSQKTFCRVCCKLSFISVKACLQSGTLGPTKDKACRLESLTSSLFQSTVHLLEVGYVDRGGSGKDQLAAGFESDASRLGHKTEASSFARMTSTWQQQRST